MHPSQQRPRTSVGSRAATTTIIFLMVGALSLGALAYGMYRVLAVTSDAPRTATHAFVGDLAHGDNRAAYDRLCRKNRATYSYAEFVDIVQGRPRPAKASITGFEVSSGTASVRASLTLIDASIESHTFELVEEGDDWKICGEPY